MPRRAKMEILFAVLLAMFLSALDQTIVGTALPRIMADLASNDIYTWVVTVYLLTSTITIPFYGKLSDLYGRKPMLVIGITLFLAGSALSGLAQTGAQLLLFRGIQGIGAGALFPIALAVIGDLFSPAERGKYQGLFGAVFGIAFLIGPALGGLLTDTVGWHWIFYINLPIGILALAVVGRLMPNIRRAGASRHLDIAGAAVFAAAVSALLLGLTNKIDAATFAVRDWTDPSVGGLIAVAAVLGAVFLLIESRSPEPIVPLGLWRSRTYAGSLAASFLASFGFFGAVIFLPRWFQVVGGASATMSGYLLFPLLAGLIGSSIASGQIVARTGRYKALMLGAAAVMGVGLLALAQISADTPWPVLFAEMFVAGVGIGPTMAVFTIIVQNAVPMDKLGVATSNLTFFRQVGGSVGLAVAGTMFAEGFASGLPAQVSPVFRQIAAAAPASAGPALAQIGTAFTGGGSSGIDVNNLLGPGSSFGQAVASLAAGGAGPAADAVRALFAPYIGALDHAFAQAMSGAVGQVFLLGVGATAAAAVAMTAIRELPLRRGASALAYAGPERRQAESQRPVIGPDRRSSGVFAPDMLALAE
jgi:EmrB/QacA subfamily drug resistance transporter